MGAHRPSARASSSPPPAPAARITRSGLRLGDRVVPLYAGAVHYFRMPPSRWRRALESVRWLGLTLVETYVPWGVHETAEGRFDFGTDDPCKDLGAFLDLARELGLYVFLRPGPHVNAELPYFGLPRRIVMDERNQARSSRGHVLPLPAPPRMFPVPSYASRNFRREVERWFAAVAAAVGKRRWPEGPVALLQVDNEASFYFRDAPYDSDYHLDALADFAAFLERRHGTIDALNVAYGTAYASFAEVSAPRRFDAQLAQPLPPCLDWMRFHDALLCDALAAMRRGLGAAGLSGLPVVHNLPMGETGLPVTLSSVGRAADLVGLDYYHLRSGVEAIRKRTLKLAGSTLLPFAPELGVGAPPWFAPRAELDSLLGMLWALAYGLRGFNLYMTVDREQWYGAPLDDDGEPRPQAERFARLLAALHRTRFHTLTRRAEVALCVPKEYAQLSRATHTLGALSPSVMDLSGMPVSAASRQDRFGFEQPIQIAWEPWLARLDVALCAAQIPFTYVEGETDLAQSPQLRALIAPCFEFADPERWQRHLAFEQRGGRLLIGPTLPQRDLDLQPHAFPALAQRGALPVRDLAEAEDVVRSLQQELALSQCFPVLPQPLRSSVHEDESGPRVVFVLNPTSEERVGELRLPRPLTLEDAMSGERFQGQDSIGVPLAAWGCRMLVLEGGARDQ